MTYVRSLLTVCASLVLAGFAHAAAAPGGVVSYNPQNKVIQGNMPLSETYILAINSPANLPPGSSVTLTMVATVLAKPTTVTDATALSFITFSVPTITFTGPNQVQTVQVTFAVPTGDNAGGYSYLVLPTGWPASLVLTQNAGATINGNVLPALTPDDNPPSALVTGPADGTEFVYLPATGQPLIVSIGGTASVTAAGHAITDIKLFLDDVEVSATTTGLGSALAAASSSVQLTAPGTYTVRVDGTNSIGTSSDTSDFTVVVVAPAPTITAASPGVNAVFTYPAGGSGVTVPVSFTASSVYGNVTALEATLNGAPVTLSLSGVGSSLTATGSASLSLTTPGDYILNLTSTNAYGDAVPLSIPFKVETTVVAVNPTVTVTPASGSIFTRVQGSPATVVNYTFTGSVPSGTITGVTVKVDGQTITPALTGLNTTNVSGGGSVSYSSPGTHTLTVTVTTGTTTTTTSTTFIVKQSYGQVCQNLIWLPPISLNKTINGGSMMPIKFRLTNGCQFVFDTATVIVIYEIYANGSISTPVVYPYGANSDPNPPDFSITGQQYHLNFVTAPGVHRYRIEVYHTFPGTTYMQLLGTKELRTREGGSGGSGGNCN